MSFIKKLFGKNKPSPEDKIGECIKSMVEICSEYIGFDNSEVDKIYIFATIEESQYVNYSYLINRELIKKHKINDFLSKKINADSQVQFQVLKICNNEVKKIVEIFENENREMFMHFKVIYDVKTKKMDTSFDYNSLLIGTELMPQDIEEDWIKKITIANKG